MPKQNASNTLLSEAVPKDATQKLNFLVTLKITMPKLRFETQRIIENFRCA